MAELILTDEEKELSLLEMDDELLGKYCKRQMCAIKNANDKNLYWETVALAAAAMLVHDAIDKNAATAEYNFEEFSIADEEHGDWIVKVRKK